jgi:CRISPR/Cas system-associated exonuclease Cas4 (RecB family)
MFDSHAADNQRVWGHDRSKTIGASEAFQCMRSNFYKKHNYTPDSTYEESYGATTRGNILEANYVVPALRAHLPKDCTILWAGDDQITLSKGRLSATPDGLVTGLPRDALTKYDIADILGDEILIEIKSFDSRLDLTEPKPVHVGQVQQQMGLVHETTNHRPEYAVILYVNASWLDDIRVFVIKRDPAVYEAAKRRADMIYAATDPKELPAEGRLIGGCAYCQFAVQCGTAQAGRVPVSTNRSGLATKDEAALKALVSEDVKVRKAIDVLETERAGVIERIKEFLVAQGRKFAKTEEGYSVSWAKAAGRKSYDIERIVADTGIDLDDYTTIGAASERLTIRAPKQNDTVP